MWSACEVVCLRSGLCAAAQNENMENLIGFNMVSYRSCKNLWKSCVEHHTFFRLHAPPTPKTSIFSLGPRFRYRCVFAC